MPIKAYYDESIATFLDDDANRILGLLAAAHQHSLDEMQRYAWQQQIAILRTALTSIPTGQLFLEFYIPRMGKRADAIVISANIVFILEFKVGAVEFSRSGLDQVEDYALDLKNFHEGSHLVPIVPLLVATDAESQNDALVYAEDQVALPLRVNSANLGDLMRSVCAHSSFPVLSIAEWSSKGYRPTPTIIEAAQVLFRDHSVEDIARKGAGTINLQQTTDSVSCIIDNARLRGKKAICFITGVPGSGKTLAGLNFATHRSEEHQDEHAVFLSGNGPLVMVLREALTRDKAERDGITKSKAEREVRSFIQNIHHFRDEYLSGEEIPSEKVVVFDEAQRAWTQHQVAKFMRAKRGIPNFKMSEPEFLISVMDRHEDWCSVVCLIGGGQEINTGEAGIGEWIRALESKFPTWEIHVSPRILLPEYGTAEEIGAFLKSSRVHTDEYLHLSVSMRSFRAESLSAFVAHVISNEPEKAQEAYAAIAKEYPIFLTRNLDQARAWLRTRARGSERFGLVAYSGAQRLRPHGIHIKAQVDPPVWFLNDRSDVRSSFYLEEVASEFDVQGLELDWAGVCWDGDFHYADGAWNFQKFSGSSWKKVRSSEDRLYMQNAYRVLLTRARQGMVLFVPEPSQIDHTRPAAFYDGTFKYLKRCGLPSL